MISSFHSKNFISEPVPCLSWHWITWSLECKNYDGDMCFSYHSLDVKTSGGEKFIPIKQYIQGDAVVFINRKT